MTGMRRGGPVAKEGGGGPAQYSAAQYDPGQRAHFNRLGLRDAQRAALGIDGLVRPDRARQRELDAFFSFAAFPTGATVLEIGCGTGNYTIPLLLKGCHVVALDVAEEAVRLLQLRARALGVASNLKAYVGSIESIVEAPPPQGSQPHRGFDCVLAVDVLHHVPDLAEAVAGMAKRLRSGGLWLCLEPNGRFPFWAYYGLVSPGFDWRYERGLRACTEDRLVAALTDAGLSAPETRYWQLLPGVLANRWPLLFKLNDAAMRLPLLRERAAFIFARATRLPLSPVPTS